MTPILITGPAAEPVSLGEAKLWMRVTANTEDALIVNLIAAARRRVETLTRLHFFTQSWRLVAQSWPASRILTLPLAPVRTVDAIRVFSADGQAQLLQPPQWSLHMTGAAAQLHFPSPPPPPGRPVAGIEIDVTTGFGDAPGDVPQELRQAIMMLVAHGFEHRGDDDHTHEAMAAIQALIAQHARPRLA